MKWLDAVERLALRAVAPRRAARRLRPPVVTRTARSARAEWSQRDHSHHQMGTPSPRPDVPCRDVCTVLRFARGGGPFQFHFHVSGLLGLKYRVESSGDFQTWQESEDDGGRELVPRY